NLPDDQHVRPAEASSENRSHEKPSRGRLRTAEQTRNENANEPILRGMSRVVTQGPPRQSRVVPGVATVAALASEFTAIDRGKPAGEVDAQLAQPAAQGLPRDPQTAGSLLLVTTGRFQDARQQNAVQPPMRPRILVAVVGGEAQ